MKKKLLIIGPILLIVVAAAGYKFAMPKKKAPKPHLAGDVVNLPGQFTLNLAGGHYATLNVALLLPGALPKTGIADEPVIRSIVTNDVTGRTGGVLISARGRSILEHQIMKSINHQTDQVVNHVYFTDLAVQ